MGLETAHKMYAVAGLLVGSGFLTAYHVGLWTDTLVLFLGGLILVTTIVLAVARTRLLARVQEQFEAHASEFTRSKDLDDLWDDLQDWMQADPRNTELLWRTSETFPTLLPIPARDPVYWLYSLRTPKKDTDEALHIVVEAKTGMIVHNAPIDDTYEFDPESPFENVPLVQQYRLAMMMDVMERRDLKQQIESFALGKLPGGYDDVTSVDAQTDAVVSQAQQQHVPGHHAVPDQGGEQVEGAQDAADRQ